MNSDLDVIIKKYTGYDADAKQLRRMGETGKALLRAAMSLVSTELSLLDIALRLTQAADKIKANVDAVPGQMVYQLNGWGELQGRAIETDVLIARRDEQITNLRLLASLVFDKA